MINAKKLLKLARKWQKLAAIRQKRIIMIQAAETNSCSTLAVAEKGRFVVYSADQKRFSLPLEYLNNEIIRALFDMAEEEFGLPRKGPLMLPCCAEFMECTIALIQQQLTGDVQKAFLMSVASCCSPFYLQHRETTNQITICSF